MDGVGLTPKGSTSADVSSDVSRDSTIRSSAANNQEKSSGRASGDVVLTIDSGDVLTITKDTAGKASFRNYVRDKDGSTRPMTDAEYEAKLNAEAHIDELAQISEKNNRSPIADELGTNGKPIHGDLAKNGWYYRTAWFSDFDGQYYRVTISTADGNNGVVVYNVGKIEKRISPAKKRGSSASVSENGARQEKFSSDDTIRSTEGNSQEKSSGRASTQVESREYAELRREYERRTKAWNEANSRNDESFPFASELRWITDAEKRMNEMKEAGAAPRQRMKSARAVSAQSSSDGRCTICTSLSMA